MTRRLGFTAALASILACACSPAVEGGGGTETETETEGSSGTAGDASATAATMTTAGTMDSTSATTSATSSTSATTNPTTAETTSLDTTVSDTGPLEVGEETGCPPGAEGCLCDVGSMCDEGLECIRGTCVAPEQCDQPEGEPNDTEAEAVQLDPANCGAEAQVIAGALGGVDIDWFAFDITGGFPFCPSTPDAIAMADSDVTVCIYAACEMGMPGASCGFGMGQMEAMSPDGLPGCCGMGMAALSGSSCGFDQLADSAVVSVSGGAENECLPYNLAWSF